MNNHILSFNFGNTDYVLISTTFNSTQLSFLVDTQADITIIKKFALSPDILIDTSRKTNIHGVTDGVTQSYGLTNAQIHLTNTFTVEQEFNVVHDSFPIPTNDILGKDFI